ncbi:extracellular solute-binding protein [Streptomyces capparidis]
MHVSTRLRTAGAGLAALALLVAGCGGDDGSGSGKTEIRYSWWGNAERAELIQKTIALFEKKHPDIKVKADFQEYESFWKKFSTQAAGGGAPDVFQNSVTFLREYGEKNVLLDLNRQVKAGNLDLSDFRADIDKIGVVDGKQYGVPVGANTFALVYRPEEFKKVGVTPKPGWTWDEYHEAVEKISDKGGIKGNSGPANTMYFYDLVLRQQGKAFFTEDGLGFTKDDLRTFWGEESKGSKEGLYVPQKKADQVAPKSVLSAGESASEFNWDNFLPRFVGESGDDLALAPIPTADGKKTGQYLSSLMLSGYARTKHPEEVAKFISFMVNDPEVGKIMGYNRGVLPTNAQFEAFKPAGPDKLVADYEQQSEPYLEPITPQPAGTGVVEAAFKRIYEDLNHGSLSVDDAVDQFFSEAEQALNKD